MHGINRENLYSLDPIEFENMVKALLIKMGFNATTTKASGDGGIDIVAINEQPIVSGKYVIQCKRYKTGNNIGEPTIRELYGIMHAENANKGILITTSDFSKQAVAFAKDKAIELINGNDLLSLLNKYLVDSENTGNYVSQVQINSSVADIEKFIDEFKLSIEREKVKTTKSQIDLIEYVKLTNPDSHFINEYSNIINYYWKLFVEISERIGTMTDLGVGKRLDSDEGQSLFYAFFITFLETEIQNPEKKIYFSLIEDYCEKTYKLLQKLFVIDPPMVAKDIYNFWIESLTQYLKIFTMLKKYLNEKNETKKILYAKVLFKSLIDMAETYLQLNSKLEDFKLKAEAEIQKSKGSCFIATVVYGNSLSPELIVLRAWRDNYLSQKTLGRYFIKFYYAIGPIVANHIASRHFLKKVIKSVLNGFVLMLDRKGR